MQATTNLDRAATGLSLACIVHCLVLPILASALPFLVVAAEAEWIHWIVALAAIAISASVPILSPSARSPGFLLPAGLGMCLIGVALFAEHFGGDETLLTVAGGCLVAFAHLRRIVRHR